MELNRYSPFSLQLKMRDTSDWPMNLIRIPYIIGRNHYKFEFQLGHSTKVKRWKQIKCKYLFLLICCQNDQQSRQKLGSFLGNKVFWQSKLYQKMSVITVLLLKTNSCTIFLHYFLLSKRAVLLNYFHIFEDHFFVFKEVFSENYVLMQGLI